MQQVVETKMTKGRTIDRMEDRQSATGAVLDVGKTKLLCFDLMIDVVCSGTARRCRACSSRA